MSSIEQRKFARRVTLRTVDRPLWYALTVEHANEGFVQDQIKRDYETYNPLLMKKYSNGVVVHKPLLPGYLFVRFDQSELSWKKLYTLQGVTGILGWAGRGPGPIPTIEIRRLMQAGNPIRAGDLVELCTGSMQGLQLSVVSVDNDHVEVSMVILTKLVKHKFRLDEVRRVK